MGYLVPFIKFTGWRLGLDNTSPQGVLYSWSNRGSSLRKLLDQEADPLDDNGEGVPELGWQQACLLVRRVGDIVVEVLVIGVSVRKLLINDGSKKVSFL